MKKWYYQDLLLDTGLIRSGNDTLYQAQEEESGLWTFFASLLLIVALLVLIYFSVKQNFHNFRLLDEEEFV